MILDELAELLVIMDRPPSLHPAEALLHTLEAHADADPCDGAVRDALLAAHGRVMADAGLRPVVGGVQREQLVRWDDTTSTWVGHDVRTGEPAMVRVARSTHARDPLLRRQLVRDARALAPLIPGLRVVDDEVQSLVAPLPGPAFQAASSGGSVGVPALARMVTHTLAGLVAWEERGLSLPRLDDAELRDAGDRLAVVVLTPQSTEDSHHALQTVADALCAWWQDGGEHPLVELIHALSDTSPDTLGDAARRTVAALATALAEERHDIVRAAEVASLANRKEALLEWVERLDVASPPPRGAAALGVDLDGHTLVVTSDGGVVLWGLPEAPEIVYDEDGFDVPVARRLVRTRGTGPISERLNAEVGGDPVFAERIARWVAAALDLRTTRLLLSPRGA